MFNVMVWDAFEGLSEAAALAWIEAQEGTAMYRSEPQARR